MSCLSGSRRTLRLIDQSRVGGHYVCECGVGVEGIKAVVLQQICPHLVGETRPAALLSQIENDDAAEVFEQRQSEPKLFPAVAAP